MPTKARELAYITCFTTGFAILVLELISFRLLAPYFGMSTYISGIIINIILLALAFGYLLGGYTADRIQSEKLPYLVILGSTIYLMAIFAIYPLLLSAISVKSLIFGSSVAVLAMFFVPTVLLAFIPPYLIKILVIKKMVGKVSGEIFSLSTLGSIAGGIMTTFIFIPYFGSRISFLLAIVLLLAISIAGLAMFNKFYFALILIFPLLLLPSGKAEEYVYMAESDYNILKVVSAGDSLYLRFNHDYAYHSKSLDPITHLSYSYYDYYLFPQMLIDADQTLILGNGAGTSMMQTHYFFDTFIDGVEIDLKVTQIGKEYFGLKLDNKLAIFHEDARTFLKKNGKKYDVVYIDIYSGDPHVPFHIATVEFFKLVNESLNEDGILATNIPYYSLDNELGEYYINTITSVFPNSYLYRKRHMLYSFKSDMNKETMSDIINGVWLPKDLVPIAKELIAAVEKTGPSSPDRIFTDDHAPIEKMAFEALER